MAEMLNFGRIATFIWGKGSEHNTNAMAMFQIGIDGDIWEFQHDEFPIIQIKHITSLDNNYQIDSAYRCSIWQICRLHT